MDLQVFFNNPSHERKRKEKPMRSLRKRKKNPVKAVYRKDNVGYKPMSLEKRLAAGLKIGAKESFTPKGQKLVVGKVKVFTDKERKTILGKIDKSIAEMRKASHVKGADKAIEKAVKERAAVEKKIKDGYERLKKEEGRMAKKGYRPRPDLSEKKATQMMKSETKLLKKAEERIAKARKKLVQELKKTKSVSKKVASEAKSKKKTRKSKAAKKVAKKVTKKKATKKKTSKKASKKKSTKRSSPKRSHRRGRSHRRRSNPIIASNPVIEILDNPKKTAKKASKKKAKKKASKKKASKKSSKKKSSKKVIDLIDDLVAPKKKKKKKKSSKKSKKVKIKATHKAKKNSRKSSYKKTKHKVKRNPSFGGAMSKLNDFTQQHLAHDLAEAGGLFAGGAVIQGVNHLTNKFVPQIKEMAAKVSPGLARSMDSILPLVLAAVGHKYVQQPHLKAVLKGVIGASVVNLGTSAYIAAARMAGAQTQLSGIIAVPEMNGIIAVPSMGAFRSADFGAPEGITSADFGGYVTEPMSGSYMQDADFGSDEPSVVAPRNPDALGAYDVEYSDGEEEQADF
jgi:hypothetical protein